VQLCLDGKQQYSEEWRDEGKTHVRVISSSLSVSYELSFFRSFSLSCIEVTKMGGFLEISSNSSNERENTLLFPNAAMSVTNGPFSTSRAEERERKSAFGPGSLLFLCMGSQRVVTQVNPKSSLHSKPHL
ncbi:hypothetical protein PO909_019540, partial [Leuciscus waleckii]